MPESLQDLEIQRSKILRQFSTLGDLRAGSISAVVRRCGKPGCHCAKSGDPGHDPQIRFTRKVGGKTVAESFPSPDALRKTQAEIDEYRRFQQLSLDHQVLHRDKREIVFKISEEPAQVVKVGDPFGNRLIFTCPI